MTPSLKTLAILVMTFHSCIKFQLNAPSWQWPIVLFHYHPLNVPNVPTIINWLKMPTMNRFVLPSMFLFYPIVLEPVSECVLNVKPISVYSSENVLLLSKPFLTNVKSTTLLELSMKMTSCVCNVIKVVSPSITKTPSCVWVTIKSKKWLIKIQLLNTVFNITKEVRVSTSVQNVQILMFYKTTEHVPKQPILVILPMTISITNMWKYKMKVYSSSGEIIVNPRPMIYATNWEFPLNKLKPISPIIHVLTVEPVLLLFK